jgi:hypothetical protein
MDTRVAEVTVSVTEGLVTDPIVAVICVVPAVLRDDASPWVPGVLLMVATDVFVEFQVALVVMFCVE